MTPAMQAARDRVVEAAKRRRIAGVPAGSTKYDPEKHLLAVVELDNATDVLLALEAQEKE